MIENVNLENRKNALEQYGVLSINFSDEKALYNQYIPFVKGCGIFVPSDEQVRQLGDEVFLLLTLPHHNEQFAVAGKVVWINPKQKFGKRVPGIGLQIMGEKAVVIKEKIEAILGKKVGSPLPTATL